VKAQSEVVCDNERNGHMSRQHGSNEINRFELPEDEEYVEETDTGDEPLRGQHNLPIQIDERFISHIHNGPDEEPANFTQGRRLCRKDQTAQHSAEAADNIAHRGLLRHEDQTA